MKKLLLIPALLALVLYTFALACVASAATDLPMDPHLWVVGICPGTMNPTSTQAGEIEFTFPPSPGCAGWLSYSFKKPVAISGTLTSNLTMVVASGVTFSPTDNNGTTPATTRFVICAKDFNKDRTCVQGSVCANLRWYADSTTDVDPVTGANIPPTAYMLADGSATLSVPLTPDHWINVHGEWGNQDQAHINAFNSAISQVVRLDQGFGAGYFFEHGVIASGPATFKLFSFGWQ